MSNYILRLDDASEKRNIDNWSRVEAIPDKYEVRPLVGGIPDCHDLKMENYPTETIDEFWMLPLSNHMGSISLISAF